MKSMILTLFNEISECMNVKEIIITDKNIALTFDGYLSNYEIAKLQNKLDIESFAIKKHNYNRMEIVFTYNSELTGV